MGSGGGLGSEGVELEGVKSGVGVRGIKGVGGVWDRGVGLGLGWLEGWGQGVGSGGLGSGVGRVGVWGIGVS